MDKWIDNYEIKEEDNRDKVCVMKLYALFIFLRNTIVIYATSVNKYSTRVSAPTSVCGIRNSGETFSLLVTPFSDSTESAEYFHDKRNNNNNMLIVQYPMPLIMIDYINLQWTS